MRINFRLGAKLCARYKGRKQRMHVLVASNILQDLLTSRTLLNTPRQTAIAHSISPYLEAASLKHLTMPCMHCNNDSMLPRTIKQIQYIYAKYPMTSCIVLQSSMVQAVPQDFSTQGKKRSSQLGANEAIIIAAIYILPTSLRENS